MSTLRMTQAVEALVDQYGADKVKDALAAVCFRKATQRGFASHAKAFITMAKALAGLAPTGV